MKPKAMAQAVASVFGRYIPVGIAVVLEPSEDHLKKKVVAELATGPFDFISVRCSKES